MIETRNLTKSYGSFQAVAPMNITIPSGKVLGLLGPNGAGKSTTIRMLTGYLAPTGGDVLFEGQSILEHSLEIRSQIGYLPELAPLYSDMLVRDYLFFVARARHIEADNIGDVIDQAAEKCAIFDVMHKPINSVSRGYKQRVGLAQAIMGDPKILVLDEPTAGLDPNQIVEIRALIKKLGEAKTVIFSTHILSEAEATCDEVCIIRKGNIVANGTIPELKERSLQSGSSFVLRLLLDGAAPDESQALRDVSGVEGIAFEALGEHLQVELTLSSDIRTQIFDRISQRGWKVLEMTMEEHSLEEIFRDLTAEPNGAAKGGN